MAIKDLKIFKTNELTLQALTTAAFDHLKSVYQTTGNQFTLASPFAQIITVTMNLGRLILFYIENTITELNIETAFQPRSVRGLATLTGHNPSRGIGARGSLYMSYNMDSDHYGETITIKNFTRVLNTSNNLVYTIVLPANNMSVTVGMSDSKIELPIIQGTVKYQQATGTGYALQSFNFANKTGDIVDNFFVNVYVNGIKFDVVDSLLDMSYEQKACVVKTSFTGGVDVFFGTGTSGYIPPQGASIVCEYLLTSGTAGNVFGSEQENYWRFMDSGYDIEGDYVDLNSIYELCSASDIIFGADNEALSVTRQLAPNMSRSFVLANPVNFKTFLRKLNIFSVIDAFSGFNTLEDRKSEEDYETAKLEYTSIKESYLAQVRITGSSSTEAQNLYNDMSEARAKYEIAKTRYEDAKLDDNVVYLYLVPDINKRLGDNENYFTASKSKFCLTEDEKTGILNLIEDSGQAMLTVDTRILDPIFVNFAINIFIRVWEGYDVNSIKSNIVSALSTYLMSGTRRDRIPVSDIIKTVESVSGVDTVTAFFDADVNNAEYYGSGNYGIDDYGDIILNRNVVDRLGNVVEMTDLIPMFHGGFTSPNGVEYSESVDSICGPVNITILGISEK